MTYRMRVLRTWLSLSLGASIGLAIVGYVPWTAISAWIGFCFAILLFSMFLVLALVWELDA